MPCDPVAPVLPVSPIPPAPPAPASVALIAAEFAKPDAAETAASNADFLTKTDAVSAEVADVRSANEVSIVIIISFSLQPLLALLVY